MGVLQTILILLRYTNKIHWKWTYVLMPLWIYLTIVLMLLIMAFVVDVRDRRTDKWN
jgi:hypothetical protein